MSAFSDLFASGFNLLIDLEAGNTITFGGVSKPCVAAHLERKITQRSSGYDVLSNPTCVMKRPDFAALQLTNRSSVVDIDGFALTYTGIEDDAADPTVKLLFLHQA